MRIIDTHLHVIDRRVLRYGWLSRAPALDQDFLLGAYQLEAKRCGVTDALHMEVDVDEADIAAETACVRKLAAEPGSLIRGAVSACRPERDDFPAFLERQLADPFIRGFRRVLHFMPDELSEGAEFRANLARLKGAKRPFDLCVLPHQVAKAIALADLCPDVQFVLDHCGNPPINERKDDPWRAAVAEIAKRPNVAVKISGVVTNADLASWRLADIRPSIEHVIDRFGWDRVVWGSDWPVCTLAGGLSTWVAAAQAICAGCSVEEREKLFAGNAKRIWGV